MNDGPLRRGDRLGPYTIVRMIAQGGMGYVYEAADQSLDRHVAIKLISGELRNKHEFALRFKREAKALARISHPNVIAVISIGQDAETLYLVMELVDGQNLRRFLASGQYLLGDLFSIMLETTAGLAGIHARDVVHRDVKLSNVMITRDGRVKIGDFGLAKVVGDAEGDVTESGQLIGTTQYMAPELFGGAPYSVKSDIFSLGVLFLEVLCGKNPFLGSSSVETAGRIYDLEADLLPEIRPYLSWELRELLHRMLAKDPAFRLSSATEVEQALRKAIANTPLSAGSSRWPKPLKLEGAAEAFAGLEKAGCWSPVERSLLFAELLQRRDPKAASITFGEPALLAALSGLRARMAVPSAFAETPTTATDTDSVPSLDIPTSALDEAPVPRGPAPGDLSIELDPVALARERESLTPSQPFVPKPVVPVELEAPLPPPETEDAGPAAKLRLPGVGLLGSLGRLSPRALLPRPRYIVLAAVVLAFVGARLFGSVPGLSGGAPECRDVAGGFPDEVAYRDLAAPPFLEAVKQGGVSCTASFECWSTLRPWIGDTLKLSPAFPQQGDFTTFEGEGMVAFVSPERDTLRLRAFQRAAGSILVIGLEECVTAIHAGRVTAFYHTATRAMMGLVARAVSEGSAAGTMPAKADDSWNLRVVERIRGFVRTGKW